MVGDRDVRVAEGARRVDHLRQRGFAVARVRVHLQVAVDLLEGDELRERVFLRERDLAAVFPHLRRNPVEAERGVDLLFRPARDTLRSPKHTVLVELELLGLGDLAQLDVVRLRAGEVLHRGTERRGLNDAQVHL